MRIHDSNITKGYLSYCCCWYKTYGLLRFAYLIVGHTHLVDMACRPLRIFLMHLLFLLCSLCKLLLLMCISKHWVVVIIQSSANNNLVVCIILQHLLTTSMWMYLCETFYIYQLKSQLRKISFVVAETRLVK